MATPTGVNEQITDAVTQVNTKVFGDVPAEAEGNLNGQVQQELARAAHNATGPQEESNVTAQSSTVDGVTTLYGVDTAPTGVDTSKLLSGKD